ncbi:ATP synthase subunit I [Alteromonas facilis]|uniref:ATP synthase subunit I n=1 Tax=Alteromonas facilis TaxID=2048004 RepID=UPI001F0B8DD0|nr:ATP synthase subunit I [Alteromonas facilis]
MNQIVSLLLVWCFGALMGGVFFGGLWWTIQKVVLSAHPALWLLTSLLLRMGLTLIGFYLVLSYELGGTPLQGLLVCLFGFVFARLLIGRMNNRSKTLAITGTISSAPRSHHAP